VAGDRSALVALGLVAVAALAKIPTLAQPLTENFAWRQTQTAWTALAYHQQGIDLLHPEVPVHGPPWTFGFEFPLFQALGALLMDAGLEPDTAMRTLGLATFLITGGLVFLLIRRLADDVAGIASLAAFLFSPFGLLWGRTSLIEYLATGLAVGCLYAAIRWLDERRRRWFAVALVAGVLAMMVKITTGVFYLVPLLAYRRDGRPLLLRDASLLILMTVSVAAGLGWTSYMDALKAASPATAFQTSSNMVGFNFGAIEMRWDLDVLLPIAAALFIGLTGAGIALWVPAAVARMRRLPQGPLLAALCASTLVGAPIVLTPLYSTQNYYPAAISPAAAALVGIGAAWAWEHARTLLGRLVLAGGIALWVGTVALTIDYWGASYQPVVDRDGSLAAAAYVRDRTGPDDWVVIGGRNYDPTVLYYARRRGYMLDPRRGIDDLATLRADPRYTLFVDCPYQAACSPLTTSP
jgi:hypothetical protein